MSEWEKVKLGEVCYFNCESYSILDNWTYVNYLDTGNITENTIGTMQIFNLLKDKLPSRARRKVRVNDLVYSSVRPNQKHYGIIKEAVDNMLVSTGFITIREKKDISYSSYIYYFLTQYKIVESLQRIVEQQVSTYPSIKSSNIESIMIKLPPLPEQCAIAATLSCLDDKIELNNRINKTLEEMAQAIFKRWFVDFEFPNEDGQPYKSSGGAMVDSKLGEIPKGWGVGKAEDFFEIAIGKTPPRKEPQWFSKSNNDIKWVSISDMRDCGVFIFNTSEYLTKEAVQKHKVKVVPANTVLLSFKLTVGRIAISSQEMTTNEAIAHFKTDKSNSNEFLYYYLYNFNYDSLGSTSSIGIAVNSKVIKAMSMMMPCEYLLNDYHNIVSPLMGEIRKNQEENQILTNIRDALLPKLMSGEIRVPIEEVV